MNNYLAINQYNEKLTFQGNTPRKALLDELYSTSAEKMYQDKKDGTTVHVGYIVRGNWWTIYTVERMEGIA